jgi:SAM-dependent methyltransferase
MGFTVTGLDDTVPPETLGLFAEHGITHLRGNLNEPDGLSHIPSGSADVVLFGEVVEHLLNAPTETLRELHRITAPKGLLVLTTPNPSTLMNAVRTLRDDYVLWGTDEFLTMPKVANGRLTSFEGIHYREYPARIMARELARVGYQSIATMYVPPGVAPTQGRMKRMAKRVLKVTGLDRTRLLCPGYVLTAHRAG